MKEKETSSDSDSVTWALLDAEEDAIVLVDLHGTILFLNASTAQRYGRSSEELIGSDLWDIYPSAYKTHHRILLNQAAQTGHSITVRHKDNEQWFQTLIYPIQEDKHEIVRVAFYIRDITAQVHAEEKLKQVLLELITAQEDERHRISQDLHDDVGQKMTALVFELRAMKETVGKDQSLSLKEINSVIRNMELIIKNVRQIFYQLYPPSITRMDLSKVLAGFCSTFEETNNVHIDFSCQEGIPELPDNFVIALYRFVQEGLTNVAKHAKATAAWVNLDYIDGDLTISLEDNGVGFDLTQVREGIGLHGIRERFLMLGGSIEVESTSGKGTRLAGTIPFRNESFLRQT